MGTLGRGMTIRSLVGIGCWGERLSWVRYKLWGSRVI
jgi:hypothetical protein